MFCGGTSCKKPTVKDQSVPFTLVRKVGHGSETRVKLPAGESILKVLTIRNPTQAELDRLLMPIKPPEIEEEE